MAVKYGKFELPTTIKIEEATRTRTFGRFIAEPFERGFGHTIGNALRRILYVALEAPAIISFRIEGVPHEYTPIEGVVEDGIHINLNLKGALLRRVSLDEPKEAHLPKSLSTVVEITQDMLENQQGSSVVTLKDVIQSSDFELVNPDHVLFTVTRPFKKRIDLKVAFGRGYVPAERHQIPDPVVDDIVIDASFSPVRLANYYVENTRVGQDTDYDRLILEITTDGRVLPQEALSFATQIAMLHFGVFDTLKLQEILFESDDGDLDEDRDALFKKLSLKINEIELSVRPTNCLEKAGIETIAELVVMPESDMLRFRNFGKRSLREIIAKLEEMGLRLGMELTKYGITPSNAREMMHAYLLERQKQEISS